MEWGEITGLEWTSGGGDVDRDADVGERVFGGPGLMGKEGGIGEPGCRWVDHR